MLFFLLAGCATEPAEVLVVSDTQDKYTALPDTLPAVIMLPTAATSLVLPDTIRSYDDELRKQLVHDGRLKPLLMGKWLATTFAQNRAVNPFEVFTSIRAEQYTVPLQAVCKTFIFRSEDYYVIQLNVFSLDANPYPVNVLRFFQDEKDIPNIVSACLEEMYARFFVQNRGAGKKRIAMESFKLDFLKLLAMESGEFEFIAAPLVTQYGLTLREDDDFFSVITGYLFAATDMFQVMRFSDFSEYSGTGAITASHADYIIRGRIQLADEINILYVDVYTTEDNIKIVTVKHPFKDPSLKNIWDACQAAVSLIVENILPSDSYGFVPPLEVPEHGFYYKNMFIGWDNLKHYTLARGMHEITTGSYLRQTEDENIPLEDNASSSLSGLTAMIPKPGISLPQTPSATEKKSATKKKESSVTKVFYILLDTENRIFTDREGEYVWNLLKKEGK